MYGPDTSTLQALFDAFSVCWTLCALLVASSSRATCSSHEITDVADYIFSNPSALNMSIKGIWLGSRVYGFIISVSSLTTPSALLTDDVTSLEVPAVDFVHKNENVFGFKLFHFTPPSLDIIISYLSSSQSFLAQIDQIADSCNYTSYLSTYLTYPPPPAPFPLPGSSTVAVPGCDVYDEIIFAALVLNPAFNIYRIFDMVCRLLCQFDSSHALYFSLLCCGTSSASRQFLLDFKWTPT